MLTVMSTCTQPSETGTVLRRQKDGTRLSVECPESVIAYNRFMGGVDRGDQLRGYYSCRMKSRKFYKYIFHFLFDTSITNAYILGKHFGSGMGDTTVKEFRMQLAQELIGDYCSRRRAGRGGGRIRPLPLQHFPLKQGPPAKRRRGRCVHCSQHSSKRSDTSWYCSACEVWLCHGGNHNTDCY